VKLVKVTVVSAFAVDNDVPAIVAVAFACTRVPLGDHALSVSTLTVKLSVGHPTFKSDNFIDVTADQSARNFIDLFVVPVASQTL